MIKDIQSLQKFVEGVNEDSFDCIENFDNDASKYFLGYNMTTNTLTFDSELGFGFYFDCKKELSDWIDSHVCDIDQFEVKSVEELRSKLEMSLFPNISFFDGEGMDYITAVIGQDRISGRVVYDYEKMIEYLREQNEMDYEDAVECIDYNTIRALPYFPNPPYIIAKIE